MPTTQEVLSLIDARFASEWDRITAGQAAYLTANGRYFQGLVTHSEIPAGDVEPDRVGDHPNDQAESWLDMGGLPPTMRSRLHIDAYESPQGHGYTVTLTARVDGTVWLRRRNVGPEADREHGWLAEPAEGL